MLTAGEQRRQASYVVEKANNHLTRQLKSSALLSIVCILKPDRELPTEGHADDSQNVLFDSYYPTCGCSLRLRHADGYAFSKNFRMIAIQGCFA